MQKKEYGIFSLPVIVGALGFFVDIYDLLLFNIVRIKSLKEINVPEAEINNLGENVLSWQMLGLVIGGILWGMLGDKKGRKSVLFGSIILYSIATIANGFVQNLQAYTVIRFIAALGLAGELGASITIVNEVLSKEKRGLGSTIIATSGVFGPIAAYFVYTTSAENWRLCYFIGGGMGLALLLLRVGFLETSLYNNSKKQNVKFGNFFMFFTHKNLFAKYLKSILIGLPVWFVIGILISFSNAFADKFGITSFNQPKALMLQYVALAFGDVCAGLLSNYLKSRKKALLIFYSILTIFIALFFITKGGGNATNMYLLCMGLGFGSGISVLYITMAAEQFGTNLRATAAISIPNMVRGFLPLLIMLFKFLRSDEMLKSYTTAAAIIGVLVLCIGFITVLKTNETFGKDLDYVEQ